MKPQTRNAGEAQIGNEAQTADGAEAIAQPEAWRQIMMLKAYLAHRQSRRGVEVVNDHGSRYTAVDTNHEIVTMNTRTTWWNAMDVGNVIWEDNKIVNSLGMIILMPTGMQFRGENA